MKTKVFIDGEAGTTGLMIHQRLSAREDLELLVIDQEKRKDQNARAEILNAADIAILCLPDEAARESVALIKNTNTRIIDASTAHRTNYHWTYGFPELDGQRRVIRNSKRVSVPGCYATGFIACVKPLTQGSVMFSSSRLVSWAITGYSGGGKQMINEYTNESRSYYSKQAICCRPKNLNLKHKHLPEMQLHSGLSHEPLFVPIVGDFDRGMLVFVSMNKSDLARDYDYQSVQSELARYYSGQKFVRVASLDESKAIGDGFLSPAALNGTNQLEIFVFGDEDKILLVARLDNLGKGSSGAAVQNLNIMLGLPEETGLV